MTRTHAPSKRIQHESGASFCFGQREDGGLHISILSSNGALLAGFSLTAEQVLQVYNELERCEECGELWGLGGSHGPGNCVDPDDPGGFGDLKC